VEHRTRITRRDGGELLATIRETDEGQVVPNEHVLSKAGVLELSCAAHPWTHGWIAVFDHPGNPRYPTYWHVRGAGLLAANIFGQHDFEREPGRDAALTMRVGQPLRFRYRVVIHPGDVNSGGVRAMYEDWVKTQERSTSR